MFLNNKLESFRHCLDPSWAQCHLEKTVQPETLEKTVKEEEQILWECYFLRFYVFVCEESAACRVLSRISVIPYKKTMELGDT